MLATHLSDVERCFRPLSLASYRFQSSHAPVSLTFFYCHPHLLFVTTSYDSLLAIAFLARHNLLPTCYLPDCIVNTSYIPTHIYTFTSKAASAVLRNNATTIRRTLRGCKLIDRNGEWQSSRVPQGIVPYQSIKANRQNGDDHGHTYRRARLKSTVQALEQLATRECQLQRLLIY